MKKLIFIAASLLALVACNKEVINAPVAGEVGYLDFNVSADNTIKVETKADPVYNITEVGEFYVEYSDQKVQYKNLPSLITLATGSYTVKAYNVDATTAEAGTGQLRMYDEKTVTVVANEAATAELRCTPYSSEVILDYTDNFLSEYGAPVFTLTKDDRQLNVTEGTKYYFNNTPDNTIEVSYKLKANGDSSSANEIFTGTLELKNAYSLKIVIDIQTENGELIFDLKASNILTGETNTITVNPYTGIPTPSGPIAD